MTDTPRTDDYESQDKEHHEEWEEAHCAWEWARLLERELDRSETERLSAMWAVNACVAIYRDHAPNEINLFHSKALKNAWRLGEGFMADQRKRDKQKLKDFTL